jgi:hypothetical protein
MKHSANQQLTLKPQDLVVLLKMAILGGQQPAYVSLAKTLWISSSEIHASLGRAQLARLVQRSELEGFTLVRSAVLDFVLFGARYAFPPIRGSLARGFPTAYAGPGLRDQIAPSDEPVPVWPSSKGNVRGITLHPLYPSVPRAIEEDPRLYEALALFDALRIGAARDRQLATDALSRILT